MKVSKVSKSSRVSRERILERARETFLARGLRSVRVEDIAVSLGISKKTLYQHFESKEELIREVVLQFFAQMLERVDQAFRSELPPLERMGRVLSTIAAAVSGIPPGLPHDMARGYPTLFQEVNLRRRELLVRHLGTVIEQGQRAGEIRRDVPAEALTRALIALIEAVGNPQFLAATGLAPAELVPLMRSFVLGGLSAKAQEVLPCVG